MGFASPLSALPAVVCKMQNTLAPISCSSLPFALGLDPSFTQVQETALFWGYFSAVFQYPKGQSIT